MSPGRRWLFLAGVLLVTPLLALLWLWNTDLGRFETTIEAQLSQALDREVRFEQLSLLPGRPIRVSARAITIAAPAWAGEQPFLLTGPVTATVKFGSLFGAGPVVLETLGVQGLELRLIRDAEGRSSAPPALTDGDSGVAPAKTALPGAPVLLKDAQLENGLLRLVGPEADNRITVQTLTLSEQDDGMIGVALDGSIDDRSMSFTGDIGPFEALLNGAAVRASGKGHFATLQVEGSVAVDSLSQPERPDIDVTLDGEGLGLLEQVFGAGTEASGPYALTIDAGSQDDRWAFRGTLRAQRLNGDVEGYATSLQDFSDAALELNLSGPDLEALLSLFAIDGAPAEPFTLAGRVKRSDRQLELEESAVTIGATTLEIAASLSDFPNLQDSQLDLAIAGPELADFRDLLGLPGAATGPFTLDVIIERDLQAAERLELKLVNELLTATASGKLSDRARLEGSEISVTVETDNGQKALAALDLPGITAAPASLEGRFHYDGDALRVEAGRLEGLYALVATVDGRVGLDDALGNLDLDVRLTGDDIGASLAAFTLPWPLKSSPFSISGRVRQQEEQLEIVLADGADSTIGSLSLGGMVTLAAAYDTGRFALRAEGDNLSDALPQLGAFAPASIALSMIAEGRFDPNHWRIERSELGLGDARLTGSGSLDRTESFAETTLSFALELPSLETLGRWNDAALPDADLRGFLEASGTGDTMILESLELGTAGTSITGQGQLLRSNGRPRVELELRSEELDLRDWFEPSTVAGAPEAAPREGRLLSAEPLPLDWMDQLDAALDFELALLRTPRRIISDIEVSARLENGELQVPRYHTKGALGMLEISGAGRRLEEGGLDLALTLDASDLVLNRIAWAQADPATLPVINARGELAARGASVAELAAGLDGELVLIATKGELPGAGLGALNLYLLEQIFDVLVPGLTTRQPTTLYCLAARVTAENGRVKTDPLVAIRTDKLLILSTGTLNLETEQLVLDFETTPTRLIGASFAELVNPFVRLQGPLTDIKPVIDPTGTLIYGSIAAATGGLSIIGKGLWDRLRKTSRPCERLRESLMADARGGSQ